MVIQWEGGIEYADKTDVAKGGWANADIGWQRREGGLGKCWLWLTKGGGLVGEMMTMADKGGRGGVDPLIFGWHNLWTAP